MRESNTQELNNDCTGWQRCAEPLTTKIFKVKFKNLFLIPLILSPYTRRGSPCGSGVSMVILNNLIGVVVCGFNAGSGKVS